jgi:uroporphyrinogen-III decarboxylase
VLSRKGISVIGGIDPVKFQEYNIPALEEYVREILNKTSKKGFVLANSDSCPPNVTIEKFKKVIEIVQYHIN